MRKKYRNYKLEHETKRIAHLKTKLDFEVSTLQILKAQNNSSDLIAKARVRVDFLTRELRKKQTNLPR